MCRCLRDLMVVVLCRTQLVEISNFFQTFRMIDDWDLPLLIIETTHWKSRSPGATEAWVPFFVMQWRKGAHSACSHMKSKVSIIHLSTVSSQTFVVIDCEILLAYCIGKVTVSCVSVTFSRWLDTTWERVSSWVELERPLVTRLISLRASKLISLKNSEGDQL